MSEVLVKVPEVSNLIIKGIHWNSKVEEYVKKGQAICKLTCDIPESQDNLLALILNAPIYKTRNFLIKSQCTGKVKQIFSLQEAQSSGVVCTIEPCLHEIEYGGICVSCGFHSEEIHEDQPEKLSCGVTAKNLKFNHEIAINLENKNKEQLLKQKKLLLVLDLDHTLLHTCLGRVEEPGTEELNIDRVTFTTKLRPHLEFFLNNLRDLYQMCVYTMGTHKYAEAIIKILDPNREYFGGRVFSK